MLVMTSLHLLSVETDSDTGGQVLVSEKQCILCHVLYTRCLTTLYKQMSLNKF